MMLSGKYQYCIVPENDEKGYRFSINYESMVYGEFLSEDGINKMKEYTFKKYSGEAKFVFSHEMSVKEWEGIEEFMASMKNN